MLNTASLISLNLIINTACNPLYQMNKAPRFQMAAFNAKQNARLDSTSIKCSVVSPIDRTVIEFSR